MVLEDITNFAHGSAVSPCQSSSKKVAQPEFYPNFSPEASTVPRRILEAEFVCSPKRSPGLQLCIDVDTGAVQACSTSPIGAHGVASGNHQIEPSTSTLAPAVAVFGPSSDQLRQLSVEPRAAACLSRSNSEGPLARRVSSSGRRTSFGSLPPRLARRSSLGRLDTQERLEALGGVPQRSGCAPRRQSLGPPERSSVQAQAPRRAVRAATPVTPREPGNNAPTRPAIGSVRTPRTQTMTSARTPRARPENLQALTTVVSRTQSSSICMPAGRATTPKVSEAHHRKEVSAPTRLRIPTASVPASVSRTPRPSANVRTRTKTPQPSRCTQTAVPTSVRRHNATVMERRQPTTAHGEMSHAGKRGADGRGNLMRGAAGAPCRLRVLRGASKRTRSHLRRAQLPHLAQDTEHATQINSAHVIRHF